jgi:multiple antibiotic resistance protein
MPAILWDFIVVLTALLVVIDPIPVAPMFAAMTARWSVAETRRTARRAAVAGAALLIFFTFFGGLLFKAIRLDLSAFRAAGGLLLLFTALDMLRGKVSEGRCSKREVEDGMSKEDISIVPLATPLLAGPGAIVTVMVLASERTRVAGGLTIVSAVVATFVITYFTLRAGHFIRRVLGVSGMALLQRLMGLLLAALAFQFIAEGARQLLFR